MHVRHKVQPSSPLNIIDVRFDQSTSIFTTSTTTGFAIYRTWPLTLLCKRDLSKGTLSIILPFGTSSLLFLVGGGRSPLYPPNKVVMWDDSLGREVAELEFRERVLGIAARREWLVVALKRRTVAFRLVDGVMTRYREWETYVNMKGLVCLATAPGSTLLAMPGRQAGHVQLIHLPPCPSPPPPPVEPSPPSLYAPLPPIPAPGPPPIPQHPPHKAPISIILAHTTPLTTLTCPPSGRLLATTSERGTLIRVWDSVSGKLVRELRRGTDKAEIYGVAFRGDESEVCVWSDKGTVHVFKISEVDTDPGGRSNRQSTFSPLSPFIKLPKYFASEWSYASYRLPGPTAHISLSSALGTGGNHAPDEDAAEEEKCVVGWIEVPVPIRNPQTDLPPPETSAKSKGRTKASDLLHEAPRMMMQYQLVALTYSGCWYRLSVPSSSSAMTPEMVSSMSPLSPTPSSSGPVAAPSSPTTTHPSSPFPNRSPKSPPISIPPSSTSGDRRAPMSNTGISTSASPPRFSSSYSPPVQSHLRQAYRAESISSGTTASASTVRRSASGRSTAAKGKERERERERDEKEGKKDRKDKKVSRECVLEEFRRFGRWDGWG